MSQEKAGKIQCSSKYKKKKVPLLFVILPCMWCKIKIINIFTDHPCMHMKNIKVMLLHEVARLLSHLKYI